MIVFEHNTYHDFIKENNLDNPNKLKMLEYINQVPMMPTLRDAKRRLRRERAKREKIAFVDDGGQEDAFIEEQFFKIKYSQIQVLKQYLKDPPNEDEQLEDAA